MSSPGSILLLHGPSSAGKSTLARALQARLAPPFWHWSIDHLRDAGVLPSARLARGDFRWADMRAAFFEGFHRSLPAFALAGNNLIVEHIIETDAWMGRLLALLKGIDVFLVVLEVPLAELERREVARGDRPVGDAKRDYETIRAVTDCDLLVDASLSPEVNAARVVEAWQERRAPSAFERMRAMRSA